ncbi:MAG TPA: hypothetical protein VK636_02720, partial [Gemmatimonadaceae bacterium]|nr:hypothetical protein [Gemmatimonadaceae bacterium]
MNVPAGTRNAAVWGVLAPAVERGNTIIVTADPATVVPGMGSVSIFPAEPALDDAGAPGGACKSA